MTVGIIKISHKPIYKWSENQFVDTTKLSIILQKATYDRLLLILKQN
jgi:hypothetical protein